MLRSTLIIVFALAVLMSCGSKKESDSDSTESSSQTAETSSSAAEKDPMENHPGKSLFRQHCGACHQMDGSGVPGMYPPLIETEQINGDVKWLVEIILNGLEGPITVKGKEYDNLMPQMSYLKDQEIADILTYVRGSFGNSSGEVTANQVAEIRANQE